MKRTTLGLCLAAFVIVGFVLWAAGMPQPAESTNSADLAVALNPDGPISPVSEVRGLGAPPAPGSVAADDWLRDIATATTIPSRALRAYANAALAQQVATPDCGLGWNMLAAIGDIESAHGAYDGAQLGQDGTVAPRILGPLLDGTSGVAVHDTDQGVMDGNPDWDRAIGPMQFLPATWNENALDGNGDGVLDPNNLDEAARTAAAYLCAGGLDLSTPEGWSAALYRYNPDDAYLTNVGEKASEYGAAASP